MNWAPFPYFRIALVFCAGIFVQEYFAVNGNFAPILVGLLIISWLLYERIAQNIALKPIISGIFILTVVFLTGMIRTQLAASRLDQSIISGDTYKYISGTIIEHLKSQNTIRFQIRSSMLVNDSMQIPVDNQLIISFKINDSIAQRYKRGDIIYIKTKLKNVKRNTNPDAFDYSKYLKYKGILQMGFVLPGDHHLIKSGGLHFFQQLASSSAYYAEKVIHQYIHDEQAISIAEALLIGKKINIRPEVYKSYADTGAVHVLSVSGMHVAIFIAIFIYLFGLWKSHNLTIGIIKVSCLLIIVWFYVFLTGMSPSVFRAGMMVSFYILGKELFRKASTYNILSITAILMLMYDPYYLFQVSFQLSFISLLSILYFQPIIEKWWYPDNKILKFTWTMVNVSLAAQILIFPFSIYIFHQMPLSFALSSILAIPLVSVVIYLGTLMIILSSLPPVAQFLGWIIEYCIVIMNAGIEWISYLPGSVIQNLYISDLVLFLLIISISLWILWNETMVKYALPLAAFALLTSVSIVTLNKIKASGQKGIVIYDLFDIDAVDVVSGRTVYRYVPEGFNDLRMEFASTNFLLKHRIQNIDSLQYYYVEWSDYSFLIWNDHLYNRLLFKEQSPDILYIPANTRLSPEIIFNYVCSDKIILSPNMRRKYKTKWLNLQAELNIRIHDIKEDGAFIHFIR
ncbi:MAG: ComEC/Rec2 family competence protein [Saprospiraceae bacterium]|nr:MAG: ComEC/Rec2-like protein [Bacteroidetes bacterium OLB9]MCO6462585.1 ComEC/Rec2 family competence protein [Saprospiraceae bacterium]